MAAKKTPSGQVEYYTRGEGGIIEFTFASGGKPPTPSRSGSDSQVRRKGRAGCEWGAAVFHRIKAGNVPKGPNGWGSLGGGLRLSNGDGLSLYFKNGAKNT